MSPTKVVDERYYVSKARGGGMLRREIWLDGRGGVARYNLAYINPLIYPHDNGRGIGYDTAHGAAHRHLKGKVTPLILRNFEQIEALFQEEWNEMAKEARHAKD